MKISRLFEWTISTAHKRLALLWRLIKIFWALRDWFKWLAHELDLVSYLGLLQLSIYRLLDLGSIKGKGLDERGLHQSCGHTIDLILKFMLVGPI